MPSDQGIRGQSQDFARLIVDPVRRQDRTRHREGSSDDRPTDDRGGCGGGRGGRGWSRRRGDRHPGAVGRVELASSSSTHRRARAVGRSAARTSTAGRLRGRRLGAGKDVLDAAAKALNLSTEDLLQKLSDGKTTIADVAKDQKVDVQTVIDAMDAVAKSDISNLVNNPFPAFGHFHAKGGLGGIGAMGPAVSACPAVRRSVASASGSAARWAARSTRSPRRSASRRRICSRDLRNGQSIADIAKSKNVDVNKLITTLVTDAKSQIDAAVKAGHLSQDQATKLEDEPPGHDHERGEQHAARRASGHFGGFGGTAGSARPRLRVRGPGAVGSRRRRSTAARTRIGRWQVPASRPSSAGRRLGVSTREAIRYVAARDDGLPVRTIVRGARHARTHPVRARHPELGRPPDLRPGRRQVVLQRAVRLGVRRPGRSATTPTATKPSIRWRRRTGSTSPRSRRCRCPASRRTGTPT